MPHVVLAHTADTGIEATAPTLEELLVELAAGMFGLVAEIRPCRPSAWVEASVTSASLEDLAVDVLSELLATAEIEDLVLCRFEITIGEPWSASLRAGGVPVASVDPTGPPIKAVTYHDLVVEERAGGWFARVYFDV